jgi:hypothetical protein
VTLQVLAEASGTALSRAELSQELQALRGYMDERLAVVRGDAAAAAVAAASAAEGAASAGRAAAAAREECADRCAELELEFSGRHDDRAAAVAAQELRCGGCYSHAQSAQ